MYNFLITTTPKLSNELYEIKFNKTSKKLSKRLSYKIPFHITYLVKHPFLNVIYTISSSINNYNLLVFIKKKNKIYQQQSFDIKRNYIFINIYGNNLFISTKNNTNISQYLILENGELILSEEYDLSIECFNNDLLDNKILNLSKMVIEPYTHKHIYLIESENNIILTLKFINERITYYDHLCLDIQSGMEQIIFHPYIPYCYLLNINNLTISVFKYIDGKLNLIQTIPYSSNDDILNIRESSTIMKLHNFNNHLYILNANTQTIHYFDIDMFNGTLYLRGSIKTQKNMIYLEFTKDGKYMIGSFLDANINIYLVEKYEPKFLYSGRINNPCSIIQI